MYLFLKDFISAIIFTSRAAAIGLRLLVVVVGKTISNFPWGYVHLLGLLQKLVVVGKMIC